MGKEGDTESENASSVIQDFVFCVRKSVVSEVFCYRYIINILSVTLRLSLFKVLCDIKKTDEI